MFWESFFEKLGIKIKTEKNGRVFPESNEAQEVLNALPEAVAPAPFDSDKYGHSISGEKYLTVMYSKIIPLLVQSLKEQKEQIEYIKSKL